MIDAFAPAPIIVTARFGPADFARLDALRRRHFPPERNLVSAHLTLFHHLPPSLAGELKRRLAEACRAPPPAARISGIMNLGRGVALRVESAGLAAIRDVLAEMFNGLLVPQDAGGWRPHVTIQNKVAPDEARALLRQMEAAPPTGPLAIAGLDAWWYRGGPWESLSSHSFRG